MTLLRGRILEAPLLAGLPDGVVLAGLLLPEDLTAGLLIGFPADFPVEGLSPTGTVVAGFSSVVTGCEGLS